MKTIGVIGLGIIGGVWTRHYAAAGVLAGCWNRTPKPDAPQWKDTPEAVAAAADMVQIVVADPPAVQDVLARIRDEGDLPVLIVSFKTWLDLVTGIKPVWTSGMKSASRRGVERAGDVTGQDGPAPNPLRSGDRHCRQERLRIGVEGILEQIIVSGQLNDLTKVHHRHPVAQIMDHTKVMGNE